MCRFDRQPFSNFSSFNWLVIHCASPPFFSTGNRQRKDQLNHGGEARLVDAYLLRIHRFLNERQSWRGHLFRWNLEQSNIRKRINSSRREVFQGFLESFLRISPHHSSEQICVIYHLLPLLAENTFPEGIPESAYEQHYQEESSAVQVDLN